MLNLQEKGMKPFALIIGASALFIAGCAAYFSVRGIALTFGAVSSFTIPIIIMASSLEFGKLVAASFLYRHWNTCNRTLRTYLLLAVGLLVCITSAGIYGYLSQAFEETLSQVEGYEKEIVSLQRQQGEFDRLIQSYQLSGQKGSQLREEKQGEERIRLERYIEERRKDITSAEQSKARLAEETDEMIVGERQKREEEKNRLQLVIEQRRSDITKLEAEKKLAKVETEERIKRETEKEVSVNQRLAELDAAVKVYRDQGPGGFLKEDGFKKAAELLKNQAQEREALRKSMSEINAAVQKARDDLILRYNAYDSRIEVIQSEISTANQEITSLTTGGAEQADNVRTALQNLQEARSSVDNRIRALESEIAEASKKITEMSEVSSAFGPDSSAELEEKKSELLTKKEDAERKILELEGKIRATDIGSFKFVARAFDAEVAAAEATENPILIEEALNRAVNRVVKWFILILVVVFDPLAVTLVIAFNAALIRNQNDEAKPNHLEIKKEEKNGGKTSPLVVLLIIGCLLFLVYEFLPDGNFVNTEKESSAKASLVGSFKGHLQEDRILSYLPDKAFTVCAFSTPRMLEEVGIPKIISDQFLIRIPFLKDLVWDPRACGVGEQEKSFYFMQLPDVSYRNQRPGDILFGLILPIKDEAKLKNFILSQLDIKAEKPNWKVHSNTLPDFHSINHHSAHISIGMDKNCLLLLTSWWTDEPDSAFLDSEMRNIFKGSESLNHSHPQILSKLRANDYDVSVFLSGENFFFPFQKSPQESGILSLFGEFLSFDISLKAKTGLDGLSITGEYDYRNDVLNAGFGLKVASLLEEARSSPNAEGLNGVFGEFVEIFLQRLDYQSVVNILSSIDLRKSQGFENFISWDCTSRTIGSNKGSFSIQAESSQSGGSSLRSAIDILSIALNPFDSSN